MESVFNLKDSNGVSLIVKCNFESLATSSQVMLQVGSETVDLEFSDLKRAVDAIHQMR